MVSTFRKISVPVSVSFPALLLREIFLNPSRPRDMDVVRGIVESQQEVGVELSLPDSPHRLRATKKRGAPRAFQKGDLLNEQDALIEKCKSESTVTAQKKPALKFSAG